tara:strand:- start:197 stop:982 length:786 start_codon:yes stop_codon:yes gene_type:complete
MSNELVVKDEISFDAVLADIDTMKKMAQKLMQSKHFQTMGEDGIFAIIQRAKSLGIHPLEALNGSLFYVNGKVGMSTEMMASLIRQKGHSVSKDPKSDNSICILHGKRADTGDTWTVRFSMEDAKRAGIDKHMYQKYPGVMIYNRSMSMLARQLFPDVIKGAGYTMDELKEISANKGLQTVEAEIVEEMASVEAIHELLHMIGRTPSDYQNKVIDFLNKHGLVEDKIPLGLYNQTHERVSKKLEEMQEELKKETQEEVASE